MAEKYLIEVEGQEREKEALRRLADMPSLLDEVLGPMGVPSDLYWIALEVEQEALIENRRGDVDILVGPLAWTDRKQFEALVRKHQESIPGLPPYVYTYGAALEVAASGGIEWPPRLDRLVAIEAKCAYFDSKSQKVKSQKSNKANGIQKQIDGLLAMGFDRVALLDLIINPPASGCDGQAWLASSADALCSYDQMRETLQKRMPDNSPAGHFAFSWGSVKGGTESTQGAGHPLLLRNPQENPLRGEAQIRQQRLELERNLGQLLAALPTPRGFPFFVHLTEKQSAP